MAKFETGATVMTRGIDEAMKKSAKEGDYRFYNFVLGSFCQRYLNADWGEMCLEDLKENDWALENGERLLAQYNVPKEMQIDGHDKIWIITEYDRSVTTILFPEEY